MFKRKYTLFFEKQWMENKVINDSYLTNKILKIARENKLYVERIFLSNIYICKIVLKGQRQNYLNFVEDLLEVVGDWLTKIKIKV